MHDKKEQTTSYLAPIDSSSVDVDQLSKVCASIQKQFDRSISNEKQFFHTRSNLFKLLEMLSMQHEIVAGQNNYLYAISPSSEQILKILDATGGYGANLLGHKNSTISKIAVNSIESGIPNLIQGCLRKKANALALKLSHLLNNELEGKNEFESVFSNSGTEAVEAALKFSLMKHFGKMAELKIELEKNYNLFEIAFNLLKENDQKLILAKYNPNLRTLKELLHYIKDHNNQVIDKKPKIIALKNAFHGKSLGSLATTYNPKYRAPFYLSDTDTIFIERENEQQLQNAINQVKDDIIFLTLDSQIAEFRRSVGKACCLIIEPIQGEAGVFELSANYLLLLQKTCTENKILFIIDEIQSGTYRTGKLAASSHHLKKSADIYIFSKALGAGIAKIGATLIDKKIYDNHFDMIHTSTFADDDFSCDIAIAALDLLTNINNDSKLDIKYELYKLKKKFPHLIKDIRGRGLMLAIELDDSLKNHSYEFKFFYDMNHLGSLFSSAFLNNENIRINTTLSNQLTFRVALSAFYENEDVACLINGFNNFLTKINSHDSNYFFKHIFKDFEISEFSKIKNIPHKTNVKKKAVFLNHPIKTSDLKKITKAFKNIDDIILDEIIENSFEFLKFEKYFSTVITDDHADELEIIMLSIPIPSHILKKIMHSKKNTLLQEKLQAAIEKSKQIGATTVGLGQFTSIISQNGLTLSNLGLNITTGNPYTTHLSCLAFKNAILKLNKVDLACFGLTGNILSQVIKIISKDVDSIRIFHHEDIYKSKKLQNSVIELINYIMKIESRITRKLKVLLEKETNQERIFDDLNKIKTIISVDSDKNNIQQANAIILGTNTNDILVYNQQVRSGTVIMDLGVPHNLDPQLFLRDDIIVILGGVAHLPISNSETIIDIPSFPLSKGEVFACMAETFSIGFSGQDEIKHIGDVTIEHIDKIASIATNHGFGLKCSKVISSL